jgi:hypothetical protein
VDDFVKKTVSAIGSQFEIECCGELSRLGISLKDLFGHFKTSGRTATASGTKVYEAFRGIDHIPPTYIEAIRSQSKFADLIQIIEAFNKKIEPFISASGKRASVSPFVQQLIQTISELFDEDSDLTLEEYVEQYKDIKLLAPVAAVTGSLLKSAHKTLLPLMSKNERFGELWIEGKHSSRPLNLAASKRLASSFQKNIKFTLALNEMAQTEIVSWGIELGKPFYRIYVNTSDDKLHYFSLRLAQ